MKAKLILTAMAMPVLFAACTSDELVPMEQTQQQTQRPLLSENFRMTTEIEAKGDVQTRYAVSESDKGALSFAWTNGDEYAAALIDNAIGLDAKYWPIIPSSGTINKFTYNESTNDWTFKENTGVGHYLFSYKYNEDDVKNRQAVSYSLPTVQKIKANDLNASIKEENKAVAAALLKGESAKAQLKNLFAYPKFRIQFDNGLPIAKVEKVVLEKTSGKGFQVAGGYNHVDVWNMFNPETIKNEIEAGYYENEKEYWEDKQTADFVLEEDEKETVNGEADVKVYEYAQTKFSKYIVAEFEDGAVVMPSSSNSSNKYIEVRFMIPGVITDVSGSDITANDMKMYIYGKDAAGKEVVYAINNVYSQFEFSENTTGDQKKRIFARNTSYTLTLKRLPENHSVMQNFHVVTSVDDWNALVANNDNTGRVLNIQAVGENFTLTGGANGAKMPTKATFNVQTELNVSGDLTLSNVTATKVNVLAGAKLTPGKNFTATEVNNFGTVNFIGRGEAYTQSGTINNYKNVTVAEDANVTFVLNNLVDPSDSDVKGALTNEGTANVILSNLGTVTNNGTINVNNSTNSGIFNNNGTFVVTNGNKTASSFTNNGGAEFINSAMGSVTCDAWSSTFTNAGYAYIADGSVFKISTNTGEIQIEKLSQANTENPNLKIATGNSNYSFEPTSATLNLKNENKNGYNKIAKLYVKGTLDLQDKGSVTSIVINKTGELELKLQTATDDNNDARMESVIVEKGSVKVTSSYTKMNTLTVKAGQSVIVESGKKLYANTIDLEKNAKLYYAGTVITDVDSENDLLAKGGKLEKTAGAGGITYNKDQLVADENQTAAYKKAYLAAMKEMIEKYWTLDATTYSKYVNETNWLTRDDEDTETDESFNIAGNLWNLSNDPSIMGEKLYDKIVENYNKWKKTNISFKDIVVADKPNINSMNATYVTVDAPADAKLAVQAAISAGEITAELVNQGNVYVYINQANDIAELWGLYKGTLAHDAVVTRWSIKYYDNKGNVTADYETKKQALKFAIRELFAAANGEGGFGDYASNPDIPTPDNMYWSVAQTSDVYGAVKVWYDNKAFAANSETSTSAMGTDNAAEKYYYNGYASATLYNIQSWYSKAYNTEMTTAAAQKAKLDAGLYFEKVLNWTSDDYTNDQLKALADKIKVKTEDKSL